MSTVGPVTDAKMARNSSFVGTLKRLFKPSHRGDDGARVGGAGLPSETTAKSPHFAAFSAERNSLDVPISEPLGGSEPYASPFASRKSVDRHLVASNSGPLASACCRSVSAAQTSFHHSLSDALSPCEARACLQRAQADDAIHTSSTWCYEQQPQQKLLGHHHTARTLRATALQIGARYENSLPALCDFPSRSCSLDIQSVANPSSAGQVVRPKSTGQTVPVSLPRFDPPPHPHPHPPTYSRLPYDSHTHESSTTTPAPLTAEPPPQRPPSAATASSSNTTLLALCPGIPAAMRRRQWCLEDYEVTKRLYKGSTSVVYRATCQRSGVPVALKVYSLSRVPPNVVHMIVREIKIHVELVHKHIAMLYGAFQDEKRLVLVQEYAGRGDLYGIYRSLNRRMSEAQLTHLVLGPFLEALTYLHARGICHRDIKPENILFTHDWRLLVADFGVSIDLNQERAVTRAGTLEYMAPEVERCPLKMLPEENKENVNLAYTTAVDIWATGVLAYELLVGFPPFVVDNGGAAETAAPAGGGGSAGGGGDGGFLAQYATRKTLSFPSSTSSAARDFITMSLAERPEERPTALQLSRHPWLAGAVQQPLPRRSAGQITSFSAAPLYPSRLGSTCMASALNTGTVPSSALAQ